MRHVVTPSDSATSYVAKAYPGLRVKTVGNVEIGGLQILENSNALPENIVVLGAIGPHKGSLQLLELAKFALIHAPTVVFHVIGYTNIDDQLLALPNVTIYGRYDQDTLAIHLQNARAKTALFLHQWPETYSYTMSEAARFGLVPVVPDIGAPAERLRAAKTGVIYKNDASIKEILDSALTASLEKDGLRRLLLQSENAVESIRRVIFDE
jgi:glycosyltransferase involved in cell wall biosynthesis